MWQKEGIDFALPDVGGVEYLIDMMSPDGLGWCSFDGMGGAQALSWSEIRDFSAEADLHLEPWESKALRVMSVAYANGLARGREPMKVSPAYDDRPSEDPGVAAERRRVSEGLKASLSNLAR